MLFNSYPFLFGFLPIVLVGFYVLGARRREWALAWLTAASLFFYAWWRPINVLLIAPSILVNYGLARGIDALSRRVRRSPEFCCWPVSASTSASSVTSSTGCSWRAR